MSDFWRSQSGDRVINLEHVMDVEFTTKPEGEVARVFSVGERVIVLKGADATSMREGIKKRGKFY